jgi:hypothetical protein
VKKGKSRMELKWIKGLRGKEVEINRFTVAQLNSQRGSAVQRENTQEQPRARATIHAGLAARS